MAYQLNFIFMMHARKFILVLIACALVAIIVFTLKGASKNSDFGSDTPIRIGIMLPLSGDAAAYGVPIMNAGILAQEEINAVGGIGEQKLEFVVEDDRCDPATGASVAQKLVNVDKVKIVFGSACSGPTLAAAPLFEESKVLLVSPAATSPDITMAGDYIFRTCPSDAGQGAVMAQYALNMLRARRAAVVSEQTEYAQGLRGAFTQALSEHGGILTADEVFQSKDTDLRAQLLKIKETNPDVVYMAAQSPATAELIVKQARALELASQILGAEIALSRDMLAKNPALFAGLIATESYFNESEDDAASFLAKYETRFKEKPTLPPYMAMMYSQTYLIKQGIEEVGDDPTALKDWLYTIKGWKHAMGELTIDANGDAIAPYAVKQVQADGTLKELMVVRPE